MVVLFFSKEEEKKKMEGIHMIVNMLCMKSIHLFSISVEYEFIYLTNQHFFSVVLKLSILLIGNT